ncbi:MAG: hypothetical protein IPG93_01540 [Burkholderiales bacterium]|nr:hypothetical protein [Burkholderiales bacterium]
MNTVKEISVVLPTEMVAVIRGVVASGEFASSIEVVQDAVDAWGVDAL